jgi:hippurate hydrolase
MPILNRVEEMQDEIAGWRRHLHQTPELLYDVEQTAAFVADKLKAFGCDEVRTGIGRTGVVGLIRGSRGEGAVIGLRADMDALPIQETTGKPWASRTPGKMHACGHDGHTAMLLGAAKYLSETRNFRGGVAVIFQPAEEGGAGGEAMVKDGMMETFAIREVYGMHNRPGLAVGEFATRKGSTMAAADHFEIVIRGQGGHAARPHTTIDPIIISAQIITGLQLISARETNPLESVVVTVASMHAGTANNIIPESATLTGTVRTLSPALRDRAEKRVTEIVTGIASSFGARAEINYERGYPITRNHDAPTERAIEVMRHVAGEQAVDPNAPPVMGAEDFSYMLEARPGAFVFIGNGATADLHNAAYDFNDEAIPYGVSYWARLAETLLAA